MNTPAAFPERALGPTGRAWFDCRAVEDCALVATGGEIDIAAAPALRGTLMDGVELSPHVVIDVSAVTFLDCTGLSSMVSALKRARLAGGSVHVVGATGAVSRLLALTGLDRVFAMDATVEEAVQSITAASRDTGATATGQEPLRRGQIQSC